MSGFFVTGGTMKPGAPSYIERAADTELFHAVLAGEYCNVLTTRQMGKSSLMARTAQRLRSEGVACATVDLQGRGDGKGERAPSAEQWYFGVVKQIAAGLALDLKLTAWWKEQEMLLPAQRMTDFLGEVALKQIEGRIVIFIDEVDWMIRLPFSDEFFAAIRSCYNRRATDGRFERLTFVLLGSAAPAQLIRDASRTPFNVGRGIELTDFTLTEQSNLAAALGKDGKRLLKRIFYWTDGHPYLTQMLCANIADNKQGEAGGDAVVDLVVQQRLLSASARQEENNLKFVADRLTKADLDSHGVLRTYRNVLQGHAVKDVPASPIFASLRLCGVVKPNAERVLRVRNEVYARVFDEAFVRQHLPRAVPLKIAVPSAVAMVLAVSLTFWYFVLFPRPYADAMERASNDVPYEAYEALNKPFHRERADELFAQFWERRGDRDRAIMVRARAGGGEKFAGLIGTDYLLLARTLRHDGILRAVAFSPNGNLVATASRDKMARVFEASNGREVARLPLQGEALAVAFSPDGRVVATGSEDKTARIFEAVTGKELLRLPHQDIVSAVAFSPDGKLVATGSADKWAHVFETVTGKELLRLSHQDSVSAVVFSPDGILVATGSLDNTVRVFETASGRVRYRVSHQDYVAAVAFSPNGKLVATGSGDGTARVFESKSGREVSGLRHKGPVTAVAFSSDSRLVATGSVDRTARVFEAASGREVSRLTHQDIVNTVAFSRNGNLVATGSRDRTARVFKAASGREISRLSHEGWVDAVAFSPDNKLLATGSWDRTARIFEAASGGNAFSRFATRDGLVEVAFSPDDKWVATGSMDGTVRVLEPTSNGRELWRFNHKESVWDVAFSPDGKFVATGSRDKTARVFDATSGREVSSLACKGPVYAVAFSPDGELVVAGSDDGTTIVFEGASGREVSRLVRPGIVNAVAFSPNGQLVASSHDAAYVFEATTGREVSRLLHQEIVHAVAFSPDGKLVATGALGKTAKLFEATSGREVSSLVQDVDSVAFSRDGKSLFIQAGDWLHSYEEDRDRWRPIGNRFLPVIWPDTLRAAQTGCPRCVELVRDVPDNLLKLDRVNMADHWDPPRGDPQKLVAEWGEKLGLKFDPQGRIIPR